MDLPLYGMRKFIASLEGKYAGIVPRQFVCRYFPSYCDQNKKPVNLKFTGCAQAFALYLGGEDGIRTRGTGYPVRQFSKLVVSATHPPLRAMSTDCSGVSSNWATKLSYFWINPKK